MESNVIDKFYNGGTGERTTIKELASLVLKLTDSSKSIEYLPEGQTFVKNRIADITNAKDDLQFLAKVPLDEGLTDLILWRNAHKSEVEQRRKAAGVD